MSDGPRPVHQPTADEIEKLKPRPFGIAMLAAPIVGTIVVFGLYSYLFVSGWTGRPAEGPVVTADFSGCAEAADVVLARVNDMGLGNPTMKQTQGGFSLTVTMPAADSDVQGIAESLAWGGHFEIRAGEKVLADSADVVSGGVRLDIMMDPSTLVILNDAGRIRTYDYVNANPDDKSQIWIDGEMVWEINNRHPQSGGEVEIPPSAEDDRARMELAAARGIALNNGPLPCEVRLERVQ